MVVMGIDPSINCTGICIYDTVTNTNSYYIITSKSTKKLKELSDTNSYITVREYYKSDPNNGEYKTKEYNKSKNLREICWHIKNILKWHDPDLVQMEGISYGSCSSAALADLAGLNFAIRMLLLDENKKFNIIAPTSVKKFAVGNGSAEKNVLIASWKKLDKNISEVDNVKLDDLADSFFIAHFNEGDH